MVDRFLPLRLVFTLVVLAGSGLSALSLSVRVPNWLGTGFRWFALIAVIGMAVVTMLDTGCVHRRRTTAASD
jgi:hypothetical protein